MDTISVNRQLSRGSRYLLSRNGTAWRGETMERALAIIGEYREQQTAEQFTRRVSLANRSVMRRAGDEQKISSMRVRLVADAFTSYNGRQTVLKLPYWLKSVDAISIAGEQYEQLADYLQVGNQLVFNRKVSTSRELTVINATIYSGDLTNFWARVFSYQDPTVSGERFYRAIWRIAMTTCSPANFGELLGAVFDVPCVSQVATVRRVIERPDFGTVVQTEHEALQGQPGDLATVQVGDVVQPGDFVFDSLQLTDLQAGIPAWLTQLTVPPSYLAAGTKSPLTISSAQQPARAVELLDGRLHVRFPWSGDAYDIELFDAALQANELQTGRLLSGELDPHELNLGSWQVKEFNWLEVLWSIWLRRGVSVSLVRDRPTSVQLHRLRQLRRCLPPWTTHLVQFLNPPDDRYVLC